MTKDKCGGCGIFKDAKQFHQCGAVGRLCRKCSFSSYIKHEPEKVDGCTSNDKENGDAVISLPTPKKDFKRKRPPLTDIPSQLTDGASLGDELVQDLPRKKATTVRLDYTAPDELAEKVRALRIQVKQLEDQLSRQQHGSVIGQAQQMLADKGSAMLSNLSQALVNGVLNMHSTMFHYIEDCAHNLLQTCSNRFRYSEKVRLLAVALKCRSGKGAIEVLRGPAGAEEGSKKTAEVMLNTNILFPSNATVEADLKAWQMKTLRP